MRPDGVSEALAARINPGDVRGYARSTGWVRVPGVNGTVVVYRDPRSDLDQLVIPKDVSASDYGRRMVEVVVNLAEREGRPAAEVVNDLLLPPSDVLRFRLADADSGAGSLALDRGIALLQGARRALLASACSVIQPRRFHPRLSRAEAEGLVGASRLGQTERRSYAVSIACPLDPGAPPRSDESLPLFPEGDDADEPVGPTPHARLPFTREVTGLLMRSVARIVTALDADDFGRLTRDDSDEIPPSANLCDALLMMRPVGDRSQLTLSASWSRAIARPDPDLHPSLVELRHDVFPAIERLAHVLRPVRVPRPSSFIGLVDELLGGPDGGDVQFRIFNQDGVTRAKATLDADDYHQALLAHGEGGYVSLGGTLIVVGRSSWIRDVQGFKVLMSEGPPPDDPASG